jgi:hypothetical protein
VYKYLLLCYFFLFLRAQLTVSVLKNDMERAHEVYVCVCLVLPEISRRPMNVSASSLPSNEEFGRIRKISIGRECLNTSLHTQELKSLERLVMSCASFVPGIQKSYNER